MIALKRIYEVASEEDGYRILVDRLWPRGMAKSKSNIDLWLKEIGPSDQLRKWFAHDPAKWNAFKNKFRAELEDKAEMLDQLLFLEKKHKKISLLYGAKDEEHNQAVVLREELEKRG